MPILTPTIDPPRSRGLARLRSFVPAAALALVGLWSCSRDGEGSRSDGRNGVRNADSADGVLDIPTRKVPPYRVIPVSTPATLRGTVDVTALTPPASSACPTNTPQTGQTRAIVWLDDIRTGLDVSAERKLDRRLELEAGRCRLEPRLQLALVGSTLNIRNTEAVAHQVQLFRDGGPQPIYRIPFILSGQLVPAERPLTVPGVLEARSTQDPSLRAVVIVVDHPYAAVIGGDGSFVIDSIPPGRYKLMAMSAAGVAEQTVELGRGGEQAVALRLAPR